MSAYRDEKKVQAQVPPPEYTALPLNGAINDSEEEEYFTGVAARSTKVGRMVTLTTLGLSAFCYYLLFGGQLPSDLLHFPDELKPGSLRSDAYETDSWGKWLMDTASNVAHLGHGGKKGCTRGAKSAAEHKAMKSTIGYMKYVIDASGADGLPEAGASRGGIDFGDDIDVSVASDDISGSTLSKVWASLFLDVPTAEGARHSSYLYTNHTHVSGTVGDRNTAYYTAKRWGELLGVKPPKHIKDIVYDAGSHKSRAAMMGEEETRHHHHKDHRHFKGGKKKGPITEPRVFIDTYYVWLNTPTNQSLTVGGNPTAENPNPEPSFTASLTEDQVGDDMNVPAEVVPAYHGYSKSGSVSHAPIVYANLGRHEDYLALEAAGVSLEGAIALVRYGGPFRGLKVRGAAERGALGCLIYTDPAEDGAVTEANGYKPYPEGPARQPSSIQRGSVQALSFYPGDPSTPGKPSYKNATRLDPEEADSLPKIPSLPISYREAAPLLRSLQGHGKVASSLGNGKDWQGVVPGVEGEYWTGPNPEVVASMSNYGDLKVQKIWNAYAIIPGYINDEVVVIGNHRDAWTFGAGDPSSGSAVFEEIVKGLGEMVKKGWKPLRTIMIASWDAEEQGLVGSTEHVEDYPAWIKENVVAYLNLDMAVSGSEFGGRSSPSLTDLLAYVANQVDDPSSPIGAEKKLEYPRGKALGSGSDFTGYLQHLGIASVDAGFSRSNTDPVYHYHSQYDNFNWMDKFGDPTWKRHVAMAKVFGLAALTSASNLFVPLNITAYAEELEHYVDKVVSLASQQAKESGNAAIAGANFEPLKQSVGQIKFTAGKLDEAKADLATRLRKALSGHHLDADSHQEEQKDNVEATKKHKHHKLPRPGRGRKDWKEIGAILREIRGINAKVTQFEQGFIAEEGLVGREWYKHLGVAPGRYLGYGATTLPGVTESITLDGGKDLQKEIERVASHFEKMAARLQIPRAHHATPVAASA